jgi:uncharacterized protein (DUF433 family)
MNVHADFWKDRLNVPAYRVKDAARYAGTTPQTIGSWQKLRGNAGNAISSRDPRALLSYMQLIELGVVAAMRRAGVPLQAIRDARDYMADAFSSQYPFAEYRFKTDGKQLILDAEDIEPKIKNKLIVVSEAGQYAWKEILQQLLREFEYTPDDDGVVIKWHVAGPGEPISIDPRVAFGAPNVNGIPTWVLRGRWDSGEAVRDIANDFDLDNSEVMSALRFENVEVDLERPTTWVN